MSGRDLAVRLVGLVLGALGVGAALSNEYALAVGGCVMFGLGIVLLLHGDGTR